MEAVVVDVDRFVEAAGYTASVRLVEIQREPHQSVRRGRRCVGSLVSHSGSSSQGLKIVDPYKPGLDLNCLHIFLYSTHSLLITLNNHKTI